MIERGSEEKRVELYYEGVVMPTGLLMDTHAKGKARRLFCWRAFVVTREMQHRFAVHKKHQTLVHMDIGYLEVVESLPDTPKMLKRHASSGTVPVCFV